MTKLTFLGDVFLPRPFACDVSLPGELVLNLEYPISSRGTPLPGKVNLRAPVSHLVDTFGRRPIAVSLANNHILDYGEVAYADTLEALRGTGVGSFGAGRVADRFANPLLLEVAGEKVALAGYVCSSTSPPPVLASGIGVAPLDRLQVLEDITRARHAGATRVIVSLHWGAEEVRLPKPADVALARAFVDAGADLIIGHHAHRIQAVEKYRGRHIFYGVGNCIMPDLRVPADFDAAGTPRREFVKTQRWWNRTSLAVTYDVRAGTVDASLLKFDGHSLRSHRGRVRECRLDPVGYPQRFRRSYITAKWLVAALNFAERPKVPRLKHFRSLLGVGRTDVYR